MIDIEGLYVSYGKQKVLKNINLHLRREECVALIGPNGSGKSTLIKCMLGMILPDQGRLNFKEMPLSDKACRKHIGYMPQISRFPEYMKTSQLFNLIKELRSDQKNYDTEMFESLGVNKFSEKPLGTLSEGMKQKVSAALAFLFQPEVLILDEPTASLDPVANELLKDKIIRIVNQGKLVVIASHILSDMDEISTRITYMLDGELWLDKSFKELQTETNHKSLNKIIPHLLQEKEHVQNY